MDYVKHNVWHNVWQLAGIVKLVFLLVANEIEIRDLPETWVEIRELSETKIM